MKTNFAIIGAAGYVAPKHMKAIYNTGNILVAAYDPSDSVGILDRYFPEAAFFTEFERFDRYLTKVKSTNRAVDYLVICSPNYLHDAHIRYGLRLGVDVICEKPITLYTHNILSLRKEETALENKVFAILQLRLLEEVKLMKQYIDQHQGDILNVDLTYITARGKWYYASWKGDENKSGGVVTNIGIHLFDLLQWFFGRPEHCEVYIKSHDRISGYMLFKKARVKWFLSINGDHIPVDRRDNGQRFYRNLTIQEHQVNLDISTDLHTKSYDEILAGRGFGLADAMEGIAIVEQIRQLPVLPIGDNAHPFCSFPLEPHPFE